MKINVELSRNLALLYSLLNRFNQAYGKPTNPLRIKIIDHFRNYAGSEPKVEDYIHEHKVVIWALSVSEPPAFEINHDISEELQWHFNKGSSIKPYLIDFYNNTDFKSFYDTLLLPELNKIKSEYESIISKFDIVNVLESAWKIVINEQMILIPNPFTQGSFGPKIDSVNYQVVGEISDSYLINNLLHEGSHPLAKEVLKPFEKVIALKTGLLEQARKHPKYSKAYNAWNTCFEEHLIRAVQIGLLNPKIISNYNILEALEKEKNNNGMVFIDTFYKYINGNSIKRAIPKILDDLK
ncbi:hypothetical protein A3F07_01355 [candidate division WWE3 bacterium RIFCSPHIGHO2_12_FULL_38_15]|uniref:DUF4932 domain-containing protein n=1 Tax=candidate division WWE3 bacterium RIFCSPHIGHO2_02_FULL_38_14 TaxID=1802620 RepID=A0A1F4V969_UNCKA|nr:MAG: hypothetical protein A2793_01940 [candidate division WWE3 bacterium RIFCSPHIGHO2_01_FULL_38_45]OGC48354.1 MAG: hypothetical protein A3F07_01355 [candidate division WWE3 bacterium RIFCSPHIGHO2_12_FULL_38_15]OGC53668.1 MAG: hypothetical protein A3D91_04495 [candidate division WWE3 bacterium RIFCSPHIGHO2_02_FULL_38_14]OGC54289.1 MAG: hypothetical protein A3B64_02155 [candidate division WWE3 bacterium RIFCSPLOWO2_01_FULL_37_24]HLB51533.1 hypothetical protein [Patescibacteria group bacterium